MSNTPITDAEAKYVHGYHGDPYPECDHVTAETCRKIEAQLSACQQQILEGQAREVRLRYELSEMLGAVEPTNRRSAWAALALPHDDTALREHDAVVLEEAANIALDHDCHTWAEACDCRSKIAHAICNKAAAKREGK